MKKDDTLWKGLIEDLFPEFLQFFYPKARGMIDRQTTFEFLDKELQDLFPSSDANLAPKFVDKLVRVKSLMEEESILVHIELQGYREKNFPERMFRYYYRIRDRYGQPVTALAIFMGSATKVVSQYYDECLGTELMYNYNVFDIWETDEDTLKCSANPFAIVVLAARTALLKGKITDRELVTQHAWLFEALEAKKLSQRKKLVISAFLESCVQFEEPRTYRTFGKQLESITGKKNPMGVIEMLKEQGLEEGRAKGLAQGHAEGLAVGRAEGHAEGLEEAKAAFVTNLLSKLHLTDEQIADVAGVDLKFVKRVKDKLKK
ncbi:putative transposase/invertase (TIGR01784 family) [Dinghuibacter silviterrae]|uniref:Putative transposase/invertase (TIGR01784 family) n=2 Tax=Dinghuibacter silviterrae TaxID=1539049 RepID=A0A4R8DS15_9BACT|nr:putative transposase/invertase (TIGR01784 family) [Dinghuibacter silviterrae]